MATTRWGWRPRGRRSWSCRCGRWRNSRSNGPGTVYCGPCYPGACWRRRGPNRIGSTRVIQSWGLLDLPRHPLRRMRNRGLERRWVQEITCDRIRRYHHRLPAGLRRPPPTPLLSDFDAPFGSVADAGQHRRENHRHGYECERVDPAHIRVPHHRMRLPSVHQVYTLLTLGAMGSRGASTTSR